MTIIEAVAAVVSAANGCSTDYIVGQLPQYTRRQITDALRLNGARHGLFCWHQTWWARSTMKECDDDPQPRARR